MRTMVAVMSLFAALGLSAAAGAQSPPRPTEGSQSKTLKVSGMACGACAAKVEGILKKVDGVTAAAVSQPKGRAEITFDPAKTNLEALAKAINTKTTFKAEVEAARPTREKM